MPTKKPVIQAVIEPEIFNKFKQIAKNEKRSSSQLGGIAIEQFVKAYEAEHGEIKIQDQEC